MKYGYLILFTSLIVFKCFATHNRAGEITYRQVSNYTFEITVTTYTRYIDSNSTDRPYLEIQWGDGTSDSISRVTVIPKANETRKNIYTKEHT